MAPPVRVQLGDGRLLLDPGISIAEARRIVSARLNCTAENVVLHVKDPDSSDHDDMWEVEGEGVFSDAVANKQTIYASKRVSRAGQKRAASEGSDGTEQRKRGRRSKPKETALQGKAAPGRPPPRNQSAGKTKATSAPRGTPRSRSRSQTGRSRANSDEGSGSAAEQKSSKKAWQNTDLNKLWKYFLREARQLPDIKPHVYSIKERNELFERILVQHPHTCKGRTIHALEAKVRQRVKEEREERRSISSRVEALFPVSRKAREHYEMPRAQANIATSSRTTLDVENTTRTTLAAMHSSSLRSTSAAEELQSHYRAPRRYYTDSGATLREVSGADTDEGRSGDDSTRVYTGTLSVSSGSSSRSSIESGSSSSSSEGSEANGTPDGNGRPEARLRAQLPVSRRQASLVHRDRLSPSPRIDTNSATETINREGGQISARHFSAIQVNPEASSRMKQPGSDCPSTPHTNGASSPHSPTDSESSTSRQRVSLADLAPDEREHQRQAIQAHTIPRIKQDEPRVFQRQDTSKHVTVKQRLPSDEQDELESHASPRRDDHHASVREMVEQALKEIDIGPLDRDTFPLDETWAHSLRDKLCESSQWRHDRNGAIASVSACFVDACTTLSTRQGFQNSAKAAIVTVLFFQTLGIALESIDVFNLSFVSIIHSALFARQSKGRLPSLAASLIAAGAYLVKTPTSSSFLTLLFENDWPADLERRGQSGARHGEQGGASDSDAQVTSGPLLYPSASEHAFRRMVLLLQQMSDTRLSIADWPFARRLAEACMLGNKGAPRLRHNAFEYMFVQTDCENPHHWRDPGLYYQVHTGMLEWNRICGALPEPGSREASSSFRHVLDASNGRASRRRRPSNASRVRSRSGCDDGRISNHRGDERGAESPADSVSPPLTRTRREDPSLFFVPDSQTQSQTQTRTQTQPAPKLES